MKVDYNHEMLDKFPELKKQHTVEKLQQGAEISEVVRRQVLTVLRGLYNTYYPQYGTGLTTGAVLTGSLLAIVEMIGAQIQSIDKKYEEDIFKHYKREFSDYLDQTKISIQERNKNESH